MRWAAPTSSFWAFSLPLFQKFKLAELRYKNQKPRFWKTLPVKHIARFHFPCRALPGAKLRNARGTTQKWISEKKTLDYPNLRFSVPEFSEFSIFRARVFRAGAKIGRGRGHAKNAIVIAIAFA